MAFFVPDLAQNSTAIRALLKKETAFQWLQDQQREFETIKEILTSELLVKSFDPELNTELLTDASRLHGLGFALVQRGKDGRPRLISCGSRSLTGAEKNYATIELELLAVWYAVKKLSFYLRGML